MEKKVSVFKHRRHELAVPNVSLDKFSCGGNVVDVTRRKIVDDDNLVVRN